MPSDFIGNRPSPARRRRGGAMVFVLVAVAVAAVMSYAILSVASLDTAGARSRLSAAQGEATAEAAARLAVHYLARPLDAPASARAFRGDGRFFYGGQDGLRLTDHADAPAADVTVTDLGQDLHEVRAVSGDRAVRALVKVTPRPFRPAAAVHARGSTSVAKHVVVDGEARLDDEAMPAFDDLTLVRELRDTDGWYTYDGELRRARRLPKEEVDGPVDPGSNNPANVYYWDGNKELLIKLPGGPRVQATLVSLEAKVTFLTSIRVESAPGMPALLMPEKLEIKNGANVTLDGVAYVADHVHSNEKSGSLTIGGALLVGDAQKEFGDHVKHDFKVAWHPDAAEVALADGVTNDVEVIEWHHD